MLRCDPSASPFNCMQRGNGLRHHLPMLASKWRTGSNHLGLQGRWHEMQPLPVQHIAHASKQNGGGVGEEEEELPFPDIPSISPLYEPPLPPQPMTPAEPDNPMPELPPNHPHEVRPYSAALLCGSSVCAERGGCLRMQCICQILQSWLTLQPHCPMQEPKGPPPEIDPRPPSQPEQPFTFPQEVPIVPGDLPPPPTPPELPSIDPSPPEWGPPSPTELPQPWR
jgi:hypothetical protein